MTTAITDGISVGVVNAYRPDYSDPDKENFLFSYHITIENQSNYTIQLLKRYWHIFDTSVGHREVKGDGVVGLQPVLRPGESYSYESACNLGSGVGKMHGTFLMERKDMNNNRVLVQIPVFEMYADFALN